MGSVLEWRGEPLQILICCGIFILLSWLLTKLIALTAKKGLRVGDPQKGHQWYFTEFLDKPTYCNSCQSTLVRGFYCESCIVCVHENCIEDATNRFACKVLVLSKSNVMKHHWVKGNLPLCSVCSVCGFQCGSEPKLCDLRCVWCHEKTHDNCLRSKMPDCDFGKYQSLILPPHCISLDLQKWTRQKKRYVVREVTPPGIKNWSPLLVFANRKSGDNEGERLLRAFRGVLNPLQVCNIIKACPSLQGERGRGRGGLPHLRPANASEPLWTPFHTEDPKLLAHLSLGKHVSANLNMASANHDHDHDHAQIIWIEWPNTRFQWSVL